MQRGLNAGARMSEVLALTARKQIHSHTAPSFLPTQIIPTEGLVKGLFSYPDSIVLRRVPWIQIVLSIA